MINTTSELTPSEVLFLRWLSKNKNTTTIPLYWVYEYGLVYKDAINKLASLGYTDYEKNITPKGAQYAEYGELLWFFHANKSLDVSINDVLKLCDTYNTTDKVELAERLLILKASTHLSSKQWGSYWGALSSLNYIVYRKTKNREKLLENYFIMFFISVNGLDNSGYPESKRDAIRFVRKVGLCGDIFGLLEQLNLNCDKSLKTKFLCAVENVVEENMHYTPSKAYNLLKRELNTFSESL